jgi:hypothetical protein
MPEMLSGLSMIFIRAKTAAAPMVSSPAAATDRGISPSQHRRCRGLRRINIFCILATMVAA